MKTRDQGRRLAVSLALFGLACGASSANAAPFLPTYAGPASEAIDLGSATVTFDGSNFTFSSTSFAPISAAPAGTLFVWGVNRGGGTARFNANPPTATSPDIGSNVLFDAAFAINPTGSSMVTLIMAGGNVVEPVSANAINISGNTITAVLPDTLFPTNGAAFGSYTADLWPRVGTGQNNQIAQFFGVTNAVNPVNEAVLVPEPGSLALLAGAVGLLGMLLRRTRPTPG